MLVTTRDKILIENNKILNTGMSGIYVSNDALTWHESGRVKSMMIRGNAFMNCEENSILILPENRRFQGFVHENIYIENNLFVLNGIPALNVNSTKNIIMKKIILSMITWTLFMFLVEIKYQWIIMV